MLPLKKIWGEATSFLARTQKTGWIDLCLLLGFTGLAFGLVSVAGEWTGQVRPAVSIDLSPWALPKYAFFSLCRGLLAFGLSLAFTLAYGYWAAKDRMAEKVLIPLLDILQSIPVLGFMPGLVLALAALFPHSNVGLELAAVLMIFTGQVWNMAFSFYQSLKNVPPALREAAAVYGFSPLRAALKLEVPSAALGLIWNGMMSMAGGWFFLTVSEAFQLGGQDFRLPGLGSYMSVAAERGDGAARLWGLLAMTALIVALDQLLWRPLVAWGQKFKIEEGGAEEAPRSWFLDLLRRSELLRLLREKLAPKPAPAAPPSAAAPAHRTRNGALKLFSALGFFLLVGGMAFGALKMAELFRRVTAAQWLLLAGESLATLGRVLLAVGLSALWTVPAGLAIGLSPRLSRLVQPVVQVAASFPAPMLYSYVLLAAGAFGLTLNWVSVALMLLGAQWYLLFNVVAGAMAIPSDLLEAARMYHLRGFTLFKRVLLPGIFPYLVTGMVTAAGGSWNASIVAEYVTDKGRTLTAFGLGSQISEAASAADFPLLAAGVLVMSILVVAFNRLVWKPLYRLAEEKYSLIK